MTSSTPGANISTVEVANIDRFGFWLLIQENEYFLPYSDFPWFRHATIDEILNVEMLSADHLCWPALDVDLHLESLSAPSAFPLIYS